MSKPMDTFESFSLPKPINDAIQKMGFTTPTPIQGKSIPLVIEGKDVVSMAQTGSGKTAAYLIPTLTRLLTQVESTPVKKQVLILVPTRELATQTMETARSLTWFVPQIKSVVLIGGASMQMQMKSLKMKPRFIIATPGRLMDHFRRRTVDLKNVDTLILDEADRMFDMGFAPQVREIAKHIPVQRQTMLFSATFPKEVRELAQKILNNPVDVSVKSDIEPPKINQKSVEVSQDAKNETTLDLINAATGSVLVFTRTKSRTDRLGRYLNEYGVKVAVIHGDRSQGQRNQAIQGFKSGQFKVLVATDIAARGIDVSSVSDVINYDLPEQFEDYIHRIGRTGRAGREGTATSLVTREDKSKWSMIARRAGLAVPASGKNQKHQPRQRDEFQNRRSEGRRTENRRPEGRRSEGRQDRYAALRDERREQRNDFGNDRFKKPFAKKQFGARPRFNDERSEEDRQHAAHKRPDHRNSHFKFNEERQERQERPAKKSFFKKPWEKMLAGRKKKEEDERSDDQRPRRSGGRPFKKFGGNKRQQKEW